MRDMLVNFAERSCSAAPDTSGQATSRKVARVVLTAPPTSRPQNSTSAQPGTAPDARMTYVA